jgi:NADH-quinone oxidoreductase subunit L
MTFYGERRTPAVAHAGNGHGDHGHGGHLHDAPGPMAIALVVLAIGSVAAGWIGIPHVLGGHNQIEGFLEPSFHAPGQAAVAEAPAAAAEGGHADATTEMMLMGLSVLVALVGIVIARTFFLKNPRLAEDWAARFSGLHRLLYNKYFVDEVYDAAIVQPIKRTSNGLLWRGMDAGLIDGTVNGVGLVVRGWSAVLRRLQTGSVRAYAMSLFFGVVLVVGYYLYQFQGR